MPLWVLLGYSGFLLRSSHVRLIGHSKSGVGVYVNMNDCLSLSVIPETQQSFSLLLPLTKALDSFALM